MIPIVAHTAQIFRSLCSIALVDLKMANKMAKLMHSPSIYGGFMVVLLWFYGGFMVVYGQTRVFPFNFMDLVENEAPKMCG